MKVNHTPTPESTPPLAWQARGWFKVWRTDRAKIIEECEGTALAALSVWDALCDLANEKRSHTFTATVGVIRTRAATSRSTTFKAMDLLEELGMLTRSQNKTEAKSKSLSASSYTLLTQSDKHTSPPSDRETTPSLSKFKKSRTEVRRISRREKEVQESAPTKASLPCADAPAGSGKGVSLARSPHVQLPVHRVEMPPGRDRSRSARSRLISYARWRSW
jgi:hypothetical protein